MDYFERDGAIFHRHHPELGAMNDVWNGEGWVPYRGDRQALVFFGDRIEELELQRAIYRGDLPRVR